MAQSASNNVVSGLLGLVLSLVYIPVAGMVAIQVEGGKLGLQFDLLNRVTGVRDPGAPWLAYAGLAVLSLLVVRLVTGGKKGWGSRGRAAFGLGFSIAPLITVIYAVFVTGPDFLLRMQTFDLLEGPHSWIDAAGNSPATHVVLAIAIAWTVSQWRKREPATTQNLNPNAPLDPTDPTGDYQIN